MLIVAHWIKPTKAQSACLLGRLAQMSEGHRLAAKRRAWTKRHEERRLSGLTDWLM